MAVLRGDLLEGPDELGPPPGAPTPKGCRGR
jgi:hypothetical protein